MDNTSVIEKIIKSLSFEVKALPKDEVKAASSNKTVPINIKIKVKKKSLASIQEGVVTISKFDKTNIPHKIHLLNSDQTIMSFNVYVESEKDKKSFKKHKKILKGLYPALCLNNITDEEDYKYTPSEKINELKNGSDIESQSDSIIGQHFLSRKRNIDKNRASSHPRKETYFLGKCKPGGCLDPPFSEDKYAYKPMDKKVPSAKVPNLDTNNIQCNTIICSENTEKNDGINNETKDNLYDNNDFKIISKPDSVVKLFETDFMDTSFSTTHSNSLITYPPTANTSREQMREYKNKKCRSLSKDLNKKSFNVLTELFFAPRKNKGKSLNMTIPKERKQPVKYSNSNSYKDYKNNTMEQMKYKYSSTSGFGTSSSFTEVESIAKNLYKTSDSNIRSELPIILDINTKLTNSQNILIAQSNNNHSSSNILRLSDTSKTNIEQEYVSNDINTRKSNSSIISLIYKAANTEGNTKMPNSTLVNPKEKHLLEKYNSIINKINDENYIMHLSSSNDIMETDIKNKSNQSPKENNYFNSLFHGTELNHSMHQSNQQSQDFVTKELQNTRRNYENYILRELESKQLDNTSIKQNNKTLECEKLDHIQHLLKVNENRPLIPNNKNIAIEENKNICFGESNKTINQQICNSGDDTGIETDKNMFHVRNNIISVNVSSGEEIVSVENIAKFSDFENECAKQHNHNIMDKSSLIESNKCDSEDINSTDLENIVVITSNLNITTNEHSKTKHDDVSIKKSINLSNTIAYTPEQHNVNFEQIPHDKQYSLPNDQDVNEIITDCNKSSPFFKAIIVTNDIENKTNITKECSDLNQNENKSVVEQKSDTIYRKSISLDAVAVNNISITSLNTYPVIKESIIVTKTNESNNIITKHVDNLGNYTQKHLTTHIRSIHNVKNISSSFEKHDSCLPKTSTSTFKHSEIKNKSKDAIDENIKNTNKTNAVIAQSLIIHNGKTKEMHSDDLEIKSNEKEYFQDSNDLYRKVTKIDSIIDNINKITHQKLSTSIVHNKFVIESFYRDNKSNEKECEEEVIQETTLDNNYINIRNELVDINDEADYLDTKPLKSQAVLEKANLESQHILTNVLDWSKTDLKIMPVKKNTSEPNSFVQTQNENQNKFSEKRNKSENQSTNDIFENNLQYVTDKIKVLPINTTSNLLNADTKDFIRQYISNTNIKDVHNKFGLQDHNMKSKSICNTEFFKDNRSFDKQNNLQANFLQKTLSKTTVQGAARATNVINPKDSVAINFGFKSYLNDNKQKVLKTIDIDKEPKYYLDNSISIVKSFIELPNKEIKIPIDGGHILSINIIKSSALTQSVHRFPPLINNKSKQDLESKQSTQAFNITIGDIQNETNNKAIHSTVNLIKIEKELMPLRNVIRCLKDDIDLLVDQQLLIREKMQRIKKTKPNRFINVNRNCGCLRE